MTNPDNVGWLPLLQFAVFDEFGKGADDRVWDYGRRCFEAGMKFEGEHGLMTTNAPKRDSAPAGGDDGATEKWCICRSCMVIVRLPADTPLPGRCQCSPSSWSLTRLRIPKGYELRREASADVERCDSCDGTGLLHRADGMYVGECHCVYSAPAWSGEVDGWKKWPIINRLQMQANDCEDAADMESDAVIMPLQLKALATDLREAAALLRKLANGGEMDDSTFQAVEDALDAIEAPITGPDGRWLTLPQRIRALSRGVPEGK